MSKAKKIILAVVIVVFSLIAISIPAAAFGWASVETGRFAEIQEDGSVLFVVHGFIACPLTVEGPFPHWHNHMTAQFNRGTSFSTNKPITYQLSKDFSAQYGMLQSGQITVDPDKNEIVFNGTYVGGYEWNRVHGRFLIKNRNSR